MITEVTDAGNGIARFGLDTEEHGFEVGEKVRVYGSPYQTATGVVAQVSEGALALDLPEGRFAGDVNPQANNYVASAEAGPEGFLKD